MTAKLYEMQPLDIPTAAGPARAHFAPGERAAVVLGHGAAGGVGAPDLLAAADAATAAGCAVALVEQPYRVAGRRSSPRARRGAPYRHARPRVAATPTPSGSTTSIPA